MITGKTALNLQIPLHFGISSIHILQLISMFSQYCAIEVYNIRSSIHHFAQPSLSIHANWLTVSDCSGHSLYQS